MARAIVDGMTTAAQTWQAQPDEWTLGARDVHVYCALLGEHRPRLEVLSSLLSADEKLRADEFRTQTLRARFVLSRGILRELLSRYLAAPPAGIAFEYGSHGKPGLHPSAGSAIAFNLSHSGDMALYAFAHGRAIGVDVENGERQVAHEKVSRRFFADTEKAELAALPADQARRGFFNCWTRKEAYLKARGRGLSVSLSDFAVSLAPGSRPALRWAADEPEAPDRWHLQAIDPGGSYVAAVCVEGEGWQPQCVQWGG